MKHRLKCLLHFSLRLDAEAADARDYPLLLIYSSGDCLWIPRVKRRVLCTHAGGSAYDCKLTYGSWTRSSEQLIPSFYEGIKKMDIEDYYEQNEYEVTENSAKIKHKQYECCTELYPSMTYNFRIERKPSYYNSASVPAGGVMVLLLTLIWSVL